MKPVTMANARTLASIRIALVVWMQSVWQRTTDPSANVKKAGLVIQFKNALPVSGFFQNQQNSWEAMHKVIGTIFWADECQINENCPQDKACVGNKCIDPCLQTSCGNRALCEVSAHRSHCFCPPGLQGNPVVSCFEVECQMDNDCGPSQYCNLNLQQCEAVCFGNSCAVGAICEGFNHKKQCSCPSPLFGDGNIYCGTKRKLVFLTSKLELVDQLKTLCSYSYWDRM